MMALAGWGVFAIVLLRRGSALAVRRADWPSPPSIRRWRLLGVPLFDRLLRAHGAGSESACRRRRSGLLFPTRWSLASYAPIVLQAATIAIAASFFTGRRKLILLAAILAGIGGIAAQSLFGDDFSIELVIQAQLWRMALAAGRDGRRGLALCALKLHSKGPRRPSRARAARPRRGSPMRNSSSVSARCAAALLVHFNAARLATPVATWPLSSSCGSAWRPMGCCSTRFTLKGSGHFFVEHSGEGSGRHGPISGTIGAISRFRSRPPRLHWPLCAGHLASFWPIEGLAALALAFAAWHFWDDGPRFRSSSTAIAIRRRLMQILAGQDGEILWLGGQTEAWFLTGRPQWASPQQGVSTIFSPKLARDWRDRTQFLIDQRLVEKEALAIMHNPSSAELMPCDERGDHAALRPCRCARLGRHAGLPGQTSFRPICSRNIGFRRSPISA